MTHSRYPCFFKILLDPSAPHLPLPPDFVKTHLENKIPNDPILRSATGGYSWNLKIIKLGESWCLSDGWECVVHDINLGFGDFLVFRFDCKKNFKLVVFSPNGCEKDIPPKPHMENNINININNNNDNSNISDSGIVDDDDDVSEDVDVDVDDEDDDEDEMDDEDEDDEEEGYEVDDDDDDDDDVGDDGDDDDDGGYIDGHDGDPFFMVVFSKGHNVKMRLPKEFAELAGIDSERDLTVANLDGKEWELGVRVEKQKHCRSERYYISAGWQDFRRSNHLSEGDECVFKFIKTEDKLLLARVTNRKRNSKTPVKAKTPESEVVKRKREIPTKKVETRATRGLKEVKRPRGRPTRGVEEVRRTRGRPFKRTRGRSTRRK